MTKHFSAITALVLLFCLLVTAQDKTVPKNGTPTTPQTKAQGGFDLTEAGVRIQPDGRLVVMMAALDAAGFDPTPQGQEPSAFRAQVRREQQDLDADLRQRLRVFFERNNRALVTATPADQSSRYVSLAYALGPAPNYEPPLRSDDLPGGLLDILDFAPLMREFYRKSGIDERLPEYLRKYQAEGDRLRPTTIEMVRNVVGYLHTRPVIRSIEQVAVRNPDPKKSTSQRFETRERERNFYIVPDLLAVPGTINFRVIADDYYVIVPFGINPSASELRRAYIRFVIDPIILKNNREVAARRAEIKTLLDQRISANDNVSADIFLAVMRSLVAATDIRMDETGRTESLTREARVKIEKTTDAAARAVITKELELRKSAVKDEAIALLAEEYERGSVLAFFFAEQLQGIESSGFDITNFFSDMITAFDPVRESRRLTENADARKRAIEARRLRQLQVAANSNPSDLSGPAVLVKKLAVVDDLLRVKNYAEAETHLRAMMTEYQGEPRIFFALGQAASLSAEDATDEDVQRERLNRALANYRLAIMSTTAETDTALVQRSYAAIGRILEFFEKTEEAIKAFDSAIKLGMADKGAYDEAVKGKARLSPPK